MSHTFNIFPFTLYTKESLHQRNIKGVYHIRISLSAKIPPHYQDWLRSLNSENHLSCIEGKGGMQDIHCIAKNARYLFLCCKISFSKLYSLHPSIYILDKIDLSYYNSVTIICKKYSILTIYLYFIKILCRFLTKLFKKIDVVLS